MRDWITVAPCTDAASNEFREQGYCAGRQAARQFAGSDLAGADRPTGA